MKIKIDKHLLWLGLIFLLAVLLRVYKLSEYPISLFGDEIDVGYHAWSLWTNGTDYSGQFLPTYIKSLSEYRAPLLMYLSAPFVGLLGPSNFSARLWSSIAGVLAVIFSYMAVFQLSKSKRMGLFAAFFLAVTPWHIFYSRAAFEVTTLLLLYFISLYLWARYDQKNGTFYFALPLVLTFYTYSTANVFTPLFGLLLFLSGNRSIRKSLPIGLICVVIVLPFLMSIYKGSAGARFQLVSVFGSQLLEDNVTVSRTKPWVDGYERIFNNKPVAIGQRILSNYLGALDPSFLFVRGDGQPRHSVFGFGLVIWVMLLPLLYGIYLSVHKNELIGRIGIVLLLFGPLASALTYDGQNHATRLFVSLVGLTLIFSIGMDSIWLKKRVLGVAVLFLSFLVLLGWWRQYTTHYVFETYKSWHYGWQQIIEEFAKDDDGKGRVFINNTKEPSLLRFVWFSKMQPSEFINMFKGDVMVKKDGYEHFKLGERYYFVNMSLDEMKIVLSPGDKYIAAQGKEIGGDWDISKSPIENFATKKVIYEPYGLPLFSYLVKQ